MKILKTFEQFIHHEIPKHLPLEVQSDNDSSYEEELEKKKKEDKEDIENIDAGGIELKVDKLRDQAGK